MLGTGHNLKKTLFISDLHLDEANPAISQQFLSLLQTSHSFDALYILGDLFEAWIGDDDDTLFHRTIIEAMKSASKKGLRIYFLRGNRDFLIGERFLNASGCKLLADEEKIILYGTPVLLMHGDTLCTHDKAYLKWRKLARHPILNRLFFLIWPLWFRRRLAIKMRAKSAMHTQKAAAEWLDVTPAAVEQVMQKHEVNYLIHGHTHRPNIHTLSSASTRIVLGAWHERGNMLIWDETGKKEFVILSTAKDH